MEETLTPNETVSTEPPADAESVIVKATRKFLGRLSPGEKVVFVLAVAMQYAENSISNGFTREISELTETMYKKFRPEVERMAADVIVGFPEENYDPAEYPQLSILAATIANIS